MSLAARVTALAQAVAADIKTLLGRAVPSGGTAGQVLTKTGEGDYAVGWSAPGGGSGAPGGATGQVQYNGNGALAGATAATVESGHVVLDGHFDTISGAAPAAPAAGRLRWYSRARAGRHLPRVIGPLGIDVALQPAMFGNSVFLWLPNTTTSASIAFGAGWAHQNNGTGAAKSIPSMTPTPLGGIVRNLFSTGTTATGASGVASSNSLVWRGNAPGLGGWFFAARLGVEVHEAAMIYFCGLSNRSTPWGGNVSATVNTIGLGKDAGDTNWHFFSVNDTGVFTKVDTGVPVVAGEVLDFTMFAAPNGASVALMLTNAVTGQVLAETQISTNLPASTTFLSAWAAARSTVGTTAKSLALCRMYIETDL